jgi:hypothetical protein
VGFHWLSKIVHTREACDKGKLWVYLRDGLGEVQIFSPYKIIKGERGGD